MGPSDGARRRDASQTLATKRSSVGPFLSFFLSSFDSVSSLLSYLSLFPLLFSADPFFLLRF